MDPLSAVASVVAILQLSVKVIGYLNDVQVASKERALCAIEVANLNSLLTDLRFRLEDADTTTPWYDATRKLGVENGPLDQFREALEELQSGMTGGGATKRLGNALMWKFKKEHVASILGRMERLKTLVQVALQNDHFKLSQAIKDCGDLTHDNTEAIKNDTSFIRHENDLAKHSKLLAWLSATEFPAQQSDFIGSRQEGTGLWFLDALQFRQWLDEQSGTLFCPGIPGAGKTMLAATAIDYLLTSVQRRSVGVAYVYCNYKSQKDQDTVALLAAILKQLVQMHPPLIQHVDELYARHSLKTTKPAADEILTTLQSALAGLSMTYVVVDALDECQDSNGTRRSFLSSLKHLQARSDMRLMVTSRNIPNINDEFCTAIRLEIRAGEEDVRQFVGGRMSRLPRCIQRNDALQDLVISSIVKAVDGMFLLARLHTDSLLDKRTPKEVKSTLANLPKGLAALDHAYSEAVHRIEGQLSGDSDLARMVLSFITYAERPLTVAELCSALAVESGTSELDPENIPDADDLVSVCAGIVVIDEESSIIRLVHYTTQEYFERIGKRWMPRAQADIASACITYLSFSAFKSGGSPTDEDFEQRMRDHNFLGYAAKHWGRHVSTVQDELCELACAFLLDQGLVMSAAQTPNIRAAGSKKLRFRGYSQRYNKKVTGLHLTCQFGLHIIAQSLIERLGDGSIKALDARNTKGQSPLHIAASNGHVKVAKLLLEKASDTQRIESELSEPKGSYVHGKDGSKWTALMCAAVRGHTEVAKLLIENGALDGDTPASRGVTPLYLAADAGHLQMLQLLVAHGVTPVLPDECGESALAKAAYNGIHVALERLLSLPGTDVHTRDLYGRSLLWWAASGGFTLTFELLLFKYHVRPEVADNFGRTPLAIAWMKRYYHVVNTLSTTSPDLAKTVGLGDRSSFVGTVFSGSADAKFVVTCDVCQINVTEHFHCWTCSEGDFDVCVTCHGKGARCLNPRHGMVRRVARDGEWIEVGDSMRQDGVKRIACRSNSMP